MAKLECYWAVCYGPAAMSNQAWTISILATDGGLSRNSRPAWHNPHTAGQYPSAGLVVRLLKGCMGRLHLVDGYMTISLI